ncbi:MAG: hypothetical protein ABEJ92_08140 [Halobacteriales archaeon]
MARFPPRQIPGGIELVVIGLLFRLPLAVLVAIVGSLASVRRGRRSRLDDLEARVEALEAAVDSNG